LFLTYHIRYCEVLEDFLAINFFCKNGPFFFFWGVFRCTDAITSTETGMLLILSGTFTFSIQAIIFYFFSTKYMRVFVFILFIFWYFFLFNLFFHKGSTLSPSFLKYFLDTEEFLRMSFFDNGMPVGCTWEVSSWVVLFFFFIHIFLFFIFLYGSLLSFSFFVSFFNYFLFIVLIFLNDALYLFLREYFWDFTILVVLFFLLAIYCTRGVATIFREGGLFLELGSTKNILKSKREHSLIRYCRLLVLWVVGGALIFLTLILIINI